MVNVPHDGHHRRTRPELFGRIGFSGSQIVFFRKAHLFHLIAELGSHHCGGVDIQGVIDGGHYAETEQHLDDLAGLDAHLVGHVRHPDGFLNADLALGGLHRLGGAGCGLLLLGLA